jgi:uncharacterized protein (TIGR03086 family)
MAVLLDVLDGSLGYADRVLAGVAERWRVARTPCPDFTVERLTSHLVGGLEWFGRLPAGGPVDPVDEPSIGLTGRPLVESYRPVADLVRRNWTAAELAQVIPMSSGPVTGAGLAAYMVVEVLGHGWDLAVATGQAARPGEPLAEAAIRIAADEIGEDMLRAPGMMGPPVTVPAGAPAMDRLVGLLGRDPALLPG